MKIQRSFSFSHSFFLFFFSWIWDLKSTSEVLWFYHMFYVSSSQIWIFKRVHYFMNNTCIIYWAKYSHLLQGEWACQILSLDVMNLSSLARKKENNLDNLFLDNHKYTHSVHLHTPTFRSFIASEMFFIVWFIHHTLVLYNKPQCPNNSYSIIN